MRKICPTKSSFFLHQISKLHIHKKYSPNLNLDSNKNAWRKKLDGNYSRRLNAVFNKSWKQHPTKQHLYGHFPLISSSKQSKQVMANVGNKLGQTHKWTFSYEVFSYELLHRDTLI